MLCSFFYKIKKNYNEFTEFFIFEVMLYFLRILKKYYFVLKIGKIKKIFKWKYEIK